MEKACYWGYLYIEYDFLLDFIYQDVYLFCVAECVKET